ncbi:Pentatricopeptide repeat-containing protein [Nymphaea thermarum]|nr:Pentatricopeptide repeat-containing protein [Nymphaea thermarum]
MAIGLTRCTLLSERSLNPNVLTKLVAVVVKNPENEELVSVLLEELGNIEGLKLKQHDCTTHVKVCTKTKLSQLEPRSVTRSLDISVVARMKLTEGGADCGGVASTSYSSLAAISPIQSEEKALANQNGCGVDVLFGGQRAGLTGDIISDSIPTPSCNGGGSDD